MRKNPTTNVTRTHHPAPVFYKDLPKIPPLDKWQPDNQQLPPQMPKYIAHNDPTIPNQLKGIKTSDKGTNKVLVPVEYQNGLVSQVYHACEHCNKAKVRRQYLVAKFE